MKQLLILILINMLFFGCKPKEKLTPNEAPTEVKASVKYLSNDTIEISWDAAKDPDGDVIVYTVVVGTDTLTKKQAATQVIFTPKNILSDYKGIIIASDNKNASSISPFEINSIYGSIDDAEFEKELIKQKIDTDKEQNGRILKQDAEKVDSLYLRLYNVKSLKSVNNFKNLKYFNVANKYNGIMEAIDFTESPKLEFLEVFGIKIVNMNIKNNTSLKHLHVQSLSFSETCEPELQTKKSLEYLSLISNENINLENLDLTNNTQLKALYIALQDTTIDLSKNINLTTLTIIGKKLHSLDLRTNTQLSYLKCTWLKLSSLDISKNTELTQLDCSYNNLIELDISNNLKIKELVCYDNPLLKNICIASRQEVPQIIPTIKVAITICKK